MAKHYQLRMLFLFGMVISATAAASARFLESRWFADLTGWHGGGGFVVEVFSREVASCLTVIPVIFAVADLFVMANVPVTKRWPGIWAFALASYVVTVILCDSALMFSQSARE